MIYKLRNICKVRDIVCSGNPTPKLTFRNYLHSHRFAEENSGVELKSNAIDLCYNPNNRDRLI